MTANATAEVLIPMVYEQLKAIASVKLQNERKDISLQTTALVHEAYLKLRGTRGDAGGFESEEHFIRAAALAMKRILVDHARSKRRLKRGGDLQRQPLTEVDASILDLPTPDYLPELAEALEKLAAQEPTAAEVLELRYFTGLTNIQVAQALGISPRSADRYWAYARAWLYRELGDGVEL